MSMEQGQQAQGMGEVMPQNYAPGQGFVQPMPQVAVVQTQPNYLLWALAALAAWWVYSNWGSLSRKLEALKTLTGGDGQ